MVPFAKCCADQPALRSIRQSHSSAIVRIGTVSDDRIVFEPLNLESQIPAKILLPRLFISSVSICT